MKVQWHHQLLITPSLHTYTSCFDQCIQHCHVCQFVRWSAYMHVLGYQPSATFTGLESTTLYDTKLTDLKICSETHPYCGCYCTDSQLDLVNTHCHCCRDNRTLPELWHHSLLLLSSWKYMAPQTPCGHFTMKVIWELWKYWVHITWCHSAAQFCMKMYFCSSTLVNAYSNLGLTSCMKCLIGVLYLSLCHTGKRWRLCQPESPPPPPCTRSIFPNLWTRNKSVV